MIKAVVGSVPHCGTQFTQQLFAPLTVADEIEGDGIISRHFYNDQLPLFRVLVERGYPLIVPLRHPAEVAKSWSKRREPVAEMCDFYRRMVSAIDPLQPAYLPIDVADRDSYIIAINERFGFELETDWVPVGSAEGTYKFSLTEKAMIANITWELRDFLGRFGYAN